MLTAALWEGESDLLHAYGRELDSLADENVQVELLAPEAARLETKTKDKKRKKSNWLCFRRRGGKNRKLER